jgi:hypothetical protein
MIGKTAAFQRMASVLEPIYTLFEMGMAFVESFRATANLQDSVGNFLGHSVAELDSCGIPAHVAIAADERIGLRETGNVFRDHRARGECYRRSSQLELVGILRHVHSSEPCRLHDHVAARGPRHRESCKAEDKLDLQDGAPDAKLSQAEHIGIISLPLRYNAARERCECDDRRSAPKTTPTCVFPACLRGLLLVH